jgi:N-acetylmuramoyl-L-alanine amidase
MSGRRESDSGDGSRSPLAQETMRYLAVSLGFAVVLATVFTAWTPASLRPGELAARLLSLVGGGAAEATQVAGAGQTGEGHGMRLGIVAGHSGPNPETGSADPGSVCPDGLTELEVNQRIAELAVQGLEEAGFQVDLLEEWDPRLTQYRAVALVSIHADACVWINDQATGYKVSGALETSVPDRTQRLVDCLADRYGHDTGLPFHAGSITRDMTEYHTFYEIHNHTPAAIIETGFLYLDREFLTQHADLAARGIVDGILCYIRNEPISLPAEATP